MRSHGTGENEEQILARMEPLATELARISKLIFENEAAINFTMLSPYYAYSVYQAAVVHHRLWKQTNEERYKDMLAMLQLSLGYLARRWTLAGNFLFLSFSANMTNCDARVLYESATIRCSCTDTWTV
jgi:hypothetical protein